MSNQCACCQKQFPKEQLKFSSIRGEIEKLCIQCEEKEYELLEKEMTNEKGEWIYED